MKKQQAKRLNPRRTKLLKLMAKGKSMTEAAKEVGYSSVQAASNAVRASRQKMADVLDKAGLTDEVLVKKYLQPLMTAEETLFFQHQGIVLDKRRVAALGIRSGALDMALKLKGSYPRNGDDKSNGAGGPPSIIINLAGIDLGTAAALLASKSRGDSVSRSDILDAEVHADAR